MNVELPKNPNLNAVKELRELYNRRKKVRLTRYHNLVEIWKKKNPESKIAKHTDASDLEAQ